MTPRDEATEAQVRAADPATSTWLSANAGSGKTRVLTDRVARLLFSGVEPQNILCLTYTKAAASEMQNRLFATLGSWAMMADAELASRLRALGIEGPLAPSDLAGGRTLFARAIETPGGLRIQTIHSFCAGLLRRFPLEAGVTPQFTEIEEGAARALSSDVLDGLTLERPDLVDGVARYITAGDFDSVLRGITANRRSFLAPPDDLNRLFDLPPDLTMTGLLSGIASPEEVDALGALTALCRTGRQTDTKAAETLAGLSGGHPLSPADLECLESVFLNKSGANKGRAKIGTFPTKDLRTANIDLVSRIEPVMQRVEEARPLRLSFAARDRTAALYAFAGEFVRRLEAAKQARGQLDFDDQIAKARALLLDPLVAQWVLFRLDGGIDHILVDEAQDTSPDQWDVVRSLAAEFAAGIGARADRDRTIFVVGDKKQSIYSFQGADPDGFDRMADHFDAALQQAGKPFARRELLFSFRSAEAVLRVVDETFKGVAREGLGARDPDHRPFHESMPGRVDLWPPVPAPEKPDDAPPWFAPVDAVSQEHQSKELARRIAAEIARMIAEGVTIPDPDRPGHRRPVNEGDILILLRGRGAMAKVSLHSEIIRACKKAGLSVAGSDRLRVGAELAVRDIEALLRFLALPEDDLALATTLRSPLFGWSEQALFTVAGKRGGKRLWPALRDAGGDHPGTMAVLTDLMMQADFLRPYDLINRILIRHDGRRRLLARLGPEAEDGIDALLSQALGYERSEVPGLTGFLDWLRSEDLEIKRQLDSAGGHLRVMTVHGAKGLEAPVVILPDTGKRPLPDRDVLYRTGDHVLWRTPAEEAPPQQVAIRDARQDAAERESRRLLYVAMTRAQSWLIVCAAGETGDALDSWYSMAEAGLEQAGAVDIDCPTGPGRRHASGDWAGAPLSPPPAQDTDAPERPAILPVCSPPPGAGGTVSPSDLGGAKALPGETEEVGTDHGLARGRLLHRLLEYLPDMAIEDRDDLAARLVAEDPDAAGLDPGEVIADAMRILGQDSLAHIFAPGTLAEIDLTAQVPALGTRVHGTVDRLIVGADTVTAIDYKSNRIIPDRAEDVPDGLLRQMGAYHALLRAIWPDKAPHVALLWTAQARLMPLPDTLVTNALAGVAPS